MRPAWVDAVLDAWLLDGMAAGVLTSRVASTLGQAAEAQRRLAAGGVRGKLILTGWVIARRSRQLRLSPGEFVLLGR